MSLILLLFPLFSPVLSKFDPFVYQDIPHHEVLHARRQGETAYAQFEEAARNATDEMRAALREDFFIKCNKLGKERERLVAESVKNIHGKADYKLLLTMGMQPFVARFLTLPKPQLEDGIKQLCTKFELQLQCQRGFGDSRKQVYDRVEELKWANGNLKMLLEEECAKPVFNPAPYHCISDEPYIWSRPCFKEMLNYNYTRYSAGRRMANLHLDAMRSVTLMTYDKDLNVESEILSVKDKVQNIMRTSLTKMTEIEAEKCDALADVMKCILPLVKQKCGERDERILRYIVEVGYLARERREDLDAHFKGFGVEPHPKCLAVNPHI